MIKKIKLKNYRCFENSEITFRGTSVIVGNNNAGKSTIIEALRITAAVSRKYKNTNYITPPLEFNLPISLKGIKVNIDHLKIDLRSVVHQYKEEEGIFSEITAYFDNDIIIRIYLSSEIIFATIEISGKMILKKYDATNFPDITLFIMPQIGLIQDEETLLIEDTVKKHIHTRLSSRHFRNELYLFRDEYFEEFKNIAQTTWDGLRISDLSYDSSSRKIELLVYDVGFAAEIGLMGSGLQMWLQIVWFISRCPLNATIVLDEPDIYMHPDLQRKIFKIVQQKFKQTIVATHSIEIISSVRPHQIVTVDKNTKKMQYADNFKAVQEVINNLGSEHNLSLIRLGISKKCIFVEGDDIKTLLLLQEIIYPNSSISISQLPYVTLGGWSRFDEALGASRLFHEETSGEIEIFCILDRDYHTEEEIEHLYIKSKENNLNLHVWKRKEIENYLVSPKSMFKLTNLPNDKFEDFCNELFAELDKLKDQTISALLDQFTISFKSNAPSTNLKMAKDTLEKKMDYIRG